MGREIETRSLTEARETVLQEIQIIRSHLDQDEEYSLRLCTDQPITRKGESLCMMGTEIDGISDLSTPESSPDFRNSTYISPGPSRTSWQEQPLMRSKFKASAIFSVQIPRKILGNSFHSAGLSGDCEQAFFYNDSEVSVFRLGNITTHTTFLNFPKTLTKPYKDGERIRNVALSCRFFIIVTNKRLLIIRVNDDALTEAIPHDGWDPSGLSCHESVTHLVILLGQCQRDKTGKHQSQIKVSSYVIGGQFQRTSTSTVQIPAHDYPNRLSLDLDGQVITCITRIQNKVLVWRLDEQFKPSASPFEFSKNRYTTVSYRDFPVRTAHFFMVNFLISAVLE